MRRKARRQIPKLRMWDDPILRKVCAGVEQDDDVEQICRDMRWLLLESKTGVGLAAPQAGYAKRIFAIKMCTTKIRFYINPIIIALTDKMRKLEEGCLSYPGRFQMVNRHKDIQVTYMCAGGQSRVINLHDFQARIAQHEMDHLNGLCAIIKETEQ